MKLYEDVSVYTLLTPPSEYEEEAGVFEALLRSRLGSGPLQLLELGCGPGHNATWFTDMALTLTDLSPTMLAAAQRNNPGATCHVGDMRSLRLGRTFDAVFVHDAVCHLTTEADVRAMVATVVAHLRPGGVALIVPDYVTETFAPGTETGGTDGEAAGVRYMSWMWRRAGQSDGYVVDYVVMHREGEGPPRVIVDRHEEGLFPRDRWLAWLRDAGLQAEVVPMGGIGDDTAFLAVRPG